MLKIKDDVDLETLKEYGFKHMIDKRVNYEWWQKGFGYRNNLMIPATNQYEDERELKIQIFSDQDELAETVYDLIKDDLVEKVEQ